MQDNFTPITSSASLASPTNLFFAAIIALLLAWVVAIPPFQNPDEGAHYIKTCANPLVESNPKRGYGHYFDQGMPDLNLLADVQPIRKDEARFSFQKFFSQPIYESEIRPFYPFAVPNTIIPYTIPYLTCKFLQGIGAQYQYLFYALRLAFAISFVLLLWYAKRIDRDIFLSCAPLIVLPMIINQGAALSADYFSIGSALIFGIIASRMTYSDSQSRWTLAWALFFLLNSKIVYLPFAAVLIIPWMRWSTYRNRKFWVPSAFLSIIALSLQYYYQTSKSHLERVTESRDKQLNMLLENPTEILDILINTIAHSWQFYLKGMIGYAGWLTTPISTPLMWVATASVIFWLALGIHKIGRFDKWIIGMLAAGVLLSGLSFLGIFLSMYLYWTHGDSMIQGVQGRYFIPLLVFVASLIFGLAKHQPGPKLQVAAFFGIFAVSIIFLFQTVIPRFH